MTDPHHIDGSWNQQVLFLTCINFNFSIASIIKYTVKLLIHSPTSTIGILKWDKQFHPTLSWACDYLSMVGLKLNRVSKRGPRASSQVSPNINVVECCMLCTNTSWNVNSRADSGLASSQWETSLQSNAVSHWLGANLETSLLKRTVPT